MNGVTFTRTAVRTLAAWDSDAKPRLRTGRELRAVAKRRRESECAPLPRPAHRQPRLRASLISGDGSRRRCAAGAAAHWRSRSGAGSRSGAPPRAVSEPGSSRAPLPLGCRRSPSSSDASRCLCQQRRSGRTGLLCCTSSCAKSTTGASTTEISTTWPQPSTPSSTHASDVQLYGASAVEHRAGMTSDDARGGMCSPDSATPRDCVTLVDPAASPRRPLYAHPNSSCWVVSDRPLSDAFSGECGRPAGCESGGGDSRGSRGP
jgi:hypothetical protein